MKINKRYMRSVFFALCCLMTFVNAKAQYPKLLIQLSDKAGVGYSFSNPSAYLSAKALARRTRFSIAIDSTDLPVSERYIDSLRAAGKVTILSKSKWLNEVLIETTDQSAITKINSFPFVRSATGIGFRVANTKPVDKLEKLFTKVAPPAGRPTGSATNAYDYGTNYNQVHIHEGEFLHNKGFHGETMQITVLDAGFYHYRTITAFDSLRINNQVLGERDFVDFDNSVNEDESHGMACLSTMTANWPGRMVGTAPKASYWLIRTENAASEYPIEEHNWVVGAEFADSTGSDMISSSLGYYNFDDPSFNHSYADFYKNATIVSKGASLAVKKGMIVMNSAGNEGGNGWKYEIFPADVDSVCSVGAVNAAGVIAGFSSYGFAGKVKPNIVSVGAGTVIAGTNNQPVTGNGTSFSNPNVAGLVACLWQAFPAVSNVNLLGAVYKSADRYTNPDNQYGFGIPDFRTAYLLLKQQENATLYGSDWFFETPNPFTSQVDYTLIGHIDGPAKVDLINAAGQIVATRSLLTEKEEVYRYSFTGLANLPAGYYTIKYADADTARTIPLQKGNILEKDWLVALPNPFRANLVVFLKAPETADINLRLLDAKGSLVEVIRRPVIQDEVTTFSFANVNRLAAGVYYVQYVSKKQKRVLRLVKL